MRPTKRAGDGGDSPRFLAVFWLWVCSVFEQNARPAPPHLTQAVSQFIGVEILF